MTTAVNRLRYFDGEYLRSFDFASEQDYHRFMRYRLNTTLHLGGIAGGLFLEEDEDSVPGYELFHVTPGIALDSQGHEIVLASPFSLSPDIVLRKKGLKAGLNNVWLVYVETSTTASSVGYAACNQQNQNTRWLETFSIDFSPSTPGPKPSHIDGAVLLGLAQIDNGPTGLRITSVENLQRPYVGVEAQRIVHPIFANAALDPTALNGSGTSITVPSLAPPDRVLPDIDATTAGPEGWLDVQAGIFGRGDFYTAGNAVIGEDFDPGANKPTLSGTRGNAKISGDLMLRGQMYFAQGNEWKKLEDIIALKVADAVPDIKLDIHDVPPDPLPGSGYQATGTATFQVTSALNVASRALILPSITRVRFALNSDIGAWSSALASKLDISVNATATLANGSQNTFDVKLTWTLNPLEGSTAVQRPIESVQLTYMMVSFKA